MNLPSEQEVTPELQNVGFVERTYRLRTKDGKYAWIFDGPNGYELLEGSRIFDSQQEAQDWHSERYAGMAIRKLVLTP